MNDFPPAGSPRRRPRTTGPCRTPIPSTLWAGTRPHHRTGYGPIPVLTRAVREFTPPHGVFAVLTGLSAHQNAAAASETLESVLTDLRHYFPPSAMPTGRTATPTDQDIHADLIIASLLPPVPVPDNTELLTRLTLTAARALNPGGILAVLTCHSHDRHGRLLDPTGPVVTAAQAADLLYLSHIVAAPVTGDTITTTLTPVCAHTRALRHEQVHLDVSVFLSPAVEDDFSATEYHAA